MCIWMDIIYVCAHTQRQDRAGREEGRRERDSIAILLHMEIDSHYPSPTCALHNPESILSTMYVFRTLLKINFGLLNEENRIVVTRGWGGEWR